MIYLRGHEIQPFMPRTLNRTPSVGASGTLPPSATGPSLSVQSNTSTVKEPGRTSYHIPSCKSRGAISTGGIHIPPATRHMPQNISASCCLSLSNHPVPLLPPVDLFSISPICSY